MIYQTAGIRLDITNKTLQVNDQPVPADDRMIALLALLFSAYPEHCKKEDILGQLWPDTIVSDWSVSKLISDTRHLLKENGCSQEVILTLHGRGYRLSSELGENISQQYPIIRNYRLRPKVFGLLVIILLGTIYFFTMPSSQIKVSEPGDSIGRLLWVDDNPSNNSQEKAYFEQQKITVYQVTNTQDALTALSLYDYKAIISDMGRQQEVLAGLKLLQQLRNDGNDTPYVLYTIVPTEEQKTLIQTHHGQGVAVSSEQLYTLVLPFFTTNDTAELNTN